MITDLRIDPFERAEYEGIGHPKWMNDRMYLIAPAAAYIGQWLQKLP